jgi:hypothetical protein
MGTIAEFVTKYKIGIQCTRVPENPHMLIDQMAAHFYCLLSLNQKDFATYYSLGSGHGHVSKTTHALIFDNPKPEAVLDCLASDVAGVESTRSFDDWASDYGYSTDSRKALATYEAIQRQSRELRMWLGNTAMDELLYDTDRL